MDEREKSRVQMEIRRGLVISRIREVCAFMLKKEGKILSGGDCRLLRPSIREGVEFKPSWPERLRLVVVICNQMAGMVGIVAEKFSSPDEEMITIEVEGEEHRLVILRWQAYVMDNLPDGDCWTRIGRMSVNTPRPAELEELNECLNMLLSVSIKSGEE
ncbi:hypothetical protein HY333_01700 [Candidatus Collierbacteria bacterium]|nr:hypothetical protein [Candidatus Collierbacteria bacterium]